jgi:hypothetical protein
MFDDDFVGFGAEAVDFEATQGQHLVAALPIVDGDEVGQQLLLAREGLVRSHPVLAVPHLNVIIN